MYCGCKNQKPTNVTIAHKNYQVCSKRLGGWYYELLYKPKELYFAAGKLELIKSPWGDDYNMNYEAESEEDLYYETDNTIIRII